MAEYKLYCLDKSGRIARRHEFEAQDDEAATEFARGYSPGTDCELWSGARKVMLIKATDAA